jgi:hypothetical protein
VRFVSHDAARPAHAFGGVNTLAAGQTRKTALRPRTVQDLGQHSAAVRQAERRIEAVAPLPQQIGFRPADRPAFSFAAGGERLYYRRRALLVAADL